MITYADSIFYEAEYLQGRTAIIPFPEFLFWATRASTYVFQSTFGRVDLEDIPDEVKHCTCEIAEVYYKDEQSRSMTAKRSESVGGYSVSYVDTTRPQDEFKANLRAIAIRWLGNTNLLYRGVD